MGHDGVKVAWAWAANGGIGGMGGGARSFGMNPFGAASATFDKGLILRPLVGSVGWPSLSLHSVFSLGFGSGLKCLL